MCRRLRPRSKMLAAFVGYNEECKSIMTTIAARLQAVRERIDAAADNAGRASAEIALLAVSKSFPVTAIAEARAAGQRAFGENYLQEAVSKLTVFQQAAAQACEGEQTHSGAVRPSAGVAFPEGTLLLPLEWHAAQAGQSEQKHTSGVRPSAGVASPEGTLLLPMEWHFIGPIQSNKTRQIAELFHWVHAVDRLKIAERLSAARPPGLPPLQICLQVNVSGEASKSGAQPDQILQLAQAVSRLPGLRLRGLMTIPEPTPVVQIQRAHYRQLRELKDDIDGQGIPLDTLSMGMSDDLEAAIAEGATVVRVGRAIFGERKVQP